MKQDFAGLPMTGWHITHDAVYIDQANPYFAFAQRISLKNLPDGTLVTEAVREFGDSIDSDSILAHRAFRITDRDTRYAYNSDNLVSCGYLKEEVHPNAGRINAEVRAYLDACFTEAAITDFYVSQGVDITDVEIWMLDWDLWNLGGRYLLFQGSSPYHMAEVESERIVYPYPTVLLYDLSSGEQVSWETLLREDWRDAVPIASTWQYPDYVEVPLPDKELTCESIYPQRDGSLDISLADGNIRYDFRVPSDYVNCD